MKTDPEKEKEDFRTAMIELCESGLLTCTRGRPGDDDATYAFSWLPLDNPEQFPEEVRERYAANMRAINKRHTKEDQT